jgi:hypothetical protein
MLRELQMTIVKATKLESKLQLVRIILVSVKNNRKEPAECMNTCIQRVQVAVNEVLAPTLIGVCLPL